MSDYFDKLEDEDREKLEEKEEPEWTDPMLATLTDDYFSDPDWIYERKLDGQRILLYIKGGDVKLGSRNRKDNTSKYPELVDALEKMELPDLIADGEIVAFEGDVSSFSKLQPRMQTKDPSDAMVDKTPVYYYLFDLIYLDGKDISRLPLQSRKALLKDVFPFSDPIRYVSHRNEEGEKYLDEACKSGWEGIIAKDANSEYMHQRSKKWLKFKCSAGQELVIGGFTDPQGERVGFGALLVGYYKGDKLMYAGKVGTGYDDETLKEMRDKMDRIERKTSPFEQDVKEKNVHWINPKLVAEVGFTEWTTANKLRHPRFLGLREDKDPKEVVKEKPSQ